MTPEGPRRYISASPAGPLPALSLSALCAGGEEVAAAGLRAPGMGESFSTQFNRRSSGSFQLDGQHCPLRPQRYRERVPALAVIDPGRVGKRGIMSKYKASNDRRRDSDDPHDDHGGRSPGSGALTPSTTAGRDGHDDLPGDDHDSRRDDDHGGGACVRQRETGWSSVVIGYGVHLYHLQAR